MRFMFAGAGEMALSGLDSNNYEFKLLVARVNICPTCHLFTISNGKPSSSLACNARKSSRHSAKPAKVIARERERL